jgi:hypothetical protein
MAAAIPDLATVHKQFLHLLAKAEAIRDSMQPNVPAQVQELIDAIEHYLEGLEDALDGEESREALKEERVPWKEAKAGLKTS